MSGSQRDSESKQTGQLTDFLFHVGHGDGFFFVFFFDRLQRGTFDTRKNVTKDRSKQCGLAGWWVGGRGSR